MITEIIEMVYQEDEPEGSDEEDSISLGGDCLIVHISYVVQPSAGHTAAQLHPHLLLLADDALPREQLYPQSKIMI